MYHVFDFLVFLWGVNMNVEFVSLKLSEANFAFEF